MRVHMNLALALLAIGSPLAGQRLTPRDSALHALNRLAYGPRPGEVERVAQLGVMRWIEQQLAPERIADRTLAERERGFAILEQGPQDLAQLFLEVRQVRQQRQREMASAETPRDPMPRPSLSPEEQRGRQLAGQFQQLAVVRAALSERQLLEVMADFWTNHFNVFLAKGADRFLTPSYIENTIRPRALGRFEELLIATAQSPAMLFYLDNARSVAPGSTPPQFARARRQRPQLAQRLPTGINENYARELLELHTLGVDGGYSQQDVVEVARIFTGWSIEPPPQGAGFVFRPWAHDRGDKQVLGVRFREDGMEEGMRFLKLLAGHHATMHHLSRKLCARFVSDEPPDGCIDDAVEAWHHSHGDISSVLLAIFRSPDFWAPAAVRAKVKTPLEFVVSAVRAVGADPDTTPRLAQVVARLGQPLYLQPVPTGYPETQGDWVNAGALLNRMNVAVALAAGRLPGVSVDLDAVVPLTTPQAPLADVVNDRILGGVMSERTKAVIRQQLAGIADPAAARAFAVGLALGGPEFQRQ